jgi:sporulation protein YlmC with PRC-barrel domain
MQFRGSARVYTADDRKVGRIMRVVLNPITKQITHIVVRLGVILTVDKLIPLSMFRSATCERVTLCGHVGNLESLPDYTESAEVPQLEMVSVPIPLGGELFAYQLTSVPVSTVGYTKGAIPKGTIALKEGTVVVGDNGETIGYIESLVVNPRTGCVTHAAIWQNSELKERKPVPISWLEIIDEDEVYLRVNPAAFERLPLY